MKAVGTLLSVVAIFGAASLLSSCGQSGESQSAGQGINCFEVQRMARDVASARMDGVQKIDLLAQVQTATQSGPIHPELGRWIVETAYLSSILLPGERDGFIRGNRANLFADEVFENCRKQQGTPIEGPEQSAPDAPAGRQNESSDRRGDGSAAEPTRGSVSQELGQNSAPTAPTPADLKALAEHEAEIKAIQAAAEEDAQAQLAAAEKEEAAARCAATLGQPDREAQLATSVAPRYPPAAARAGISGDVQVEVDFDSNGHVLDVRVVSSSRNRDLDRSAMEAARRWQFDPGVLGGCPRGGGTMRSTLHFNPDEPVVVG